jgi:hypothetical protein
MAFVVQPRNVNHPTPADDKTMMLKDNIADFAVLGWVTTKENRAPL